MWRELLAVLTQTKKDDVGNLRKGTNIGILLKILKAQEYKRCDISEPSNEFTRISTMYDDKKWSNDRKYLRPATENQ